MTLDSTFSLQKKIISWRLFIIIISSVISLCSLTLCLPLAYLSERGVSLKSLSWVDHYFITLKIQPFYWLNLYKIWIINSFSHHSPPYWILLAPLSGLTILGISLMVHPFPDRDPIHGTARWANDVDIKLMKLKQGFVIVLGQWKGRLLKLPETLSALCIAPPGTGKTVAIVIPTIVTSPTLSMVINDIKPELFQLTSATRCKIGPVYRLDWAALDDPENESCHPCWNPLSRRDMPSSPASRDLYIDRICMVLVPDPQGQADPHWSKKARAALSGFIHYILDKCDFDAGIGLPHQWQGKEACFAMLLDWITEKTLEISDHLEKLRQDDPNQAMLADPWRLFLLSMIEEARTNRYHPRIIQELSLLANTPDRERGSILSTMEGGLSIFKNAAIRERTSRSDFSFSELRGAQDPRFKHLVPITIYLCVNQQDSKTLSIMTGLFVESLTSYLISHPPHFQDKFGQILGSYSVLFILDEFPQMPKLQALIDGPAVGRGQKISYLLVGQDFGQIEEKYGKTGLETVLSTTSAKIIFPQNNDIAAKRFSEMVGTFTYEGEAKSRTYGLSKQANPFAVTINKTLSAVSFLQPADFMTMPSGTHIVLIQGHINKPIRVKTPYYFNDFNLKRYVYNQAHNRILKPALSMPPWFQKSKSIVQKDERRTKL